MLLLVATDDQATKEVLLDRAVMHLDHPLLAEALDIMKGATPRLAKQRVFEDKFFQDVEGRP